MFRKWCCALLLVTFVPDARGEPPQGVAVIVNPKNGGTAPSRAELRSVALLERQFWPDGTRVVLLLPPGGSLEKRVLLQRVYEMSEEELRAHWRSQLFAGRIAAIPSVVRSSEAAAAAVKQSHGAIAFVRAADVPPGVRVLTIDGKQPSDPGYPLK